MRVAAASRRRHERRRPLKGDGLPGDREHPDAGTGRSGFRHLQDACQSAAIFLYDDLVGRSCGVGESRRRDERGGVRLRSAQARGRPARRPSRLPSSCATGWPRRSGRSPSPTTSASATTCPRLAAARSCGGCCAASQGRGDHAGLDAGEPGGPGAAAARKWKS